MFKICIIGLIFLVSSLRKVLIMPRRYEDLEKTKLNDRWLILQLTAIKSKQKNKNEEAEKVKKSEDAATIIK